MGLERLVEPQAADYIGKAALEEIRVGGRRVASSSASRSPATRCRSSSRASATRCPTAEPVGHRHRPHLVAAAREEHRLRLGADRARRAPATRSRSSRPTAGSGRPAPPRSRSSTRARTSPRADPILARRSRPRDPTPRRSPPTRSPPSASRTGPPRCCPGGPITTRRSTTSSARSGSGATGWSSGAKRTPPTPGTYFLATVDDEPLAHRPRPRRRPARLLQRLPPPRHGGRRGAVRQGRPVPVPVPRLDLRPRGQARPGQAHRGPRRLQPGGLRARARPAGDVAGVRLRQPRPGRRRS